MTPRQVLSCALLLLVGWLLQCIIGKEIELTSEWQFLGENDTLPAGAHIRMDLSTGGRWAKLAEDGKDTVETVEIDSSGGVVSVQKEEAGKSEPEYDYDMMYRTLSQLPEEEQERIGGLPELPAGTVDPRTRKAFEKRMKEIWLQRQAELEAVQEEFMADMPKLLLERIRRIDAYLQDPHAHLSEEWIEDEDTVTHMVSVLQDLEQHLSDVDMTRDFHTLGGWPLLASLLSDGIHQSYNQTLTPEQLERVSEIQTHAAWAIGTAVKNIQEFSPYAVEELSIDGVKTTPVQLLLDQVRKDSDSKKLQKVIYALGCLMRGNRPAQALFCSRSGPSILGEVLSDLTPNDAKLTRRILSLADDIVSDVVLHPHEEQMDKGIIEAFANDGFCQSTVRLLEQHAPQETALQTIRTMEPYCQWDKGVVRTSVEKIKSSWEANKDGLDSEHLKERLELADAVLNGL